MKYNVWFGLTLGLMWRPVWKSMGWFERSRCSDRVRRPGHGESLADSRLIREVRRRRCARSPITWLQEGPGRAEAASLTRTTQHRKIGRLRIGRKNAPNSNSQLEYNARQLSSVIRTLVDLRSKREKWTLPAMKYISNQASLRLFKDKKPFVKNSITQLVQNVAMQKWGYVMVKSCKVRVNT